MDDETKDVPVVQKTPEGEPEPEAGEEGAELTPEQIADLKTKADASSQNFERAKKAEARLKEFEKPEVKVDAPKEEGLSSKDVIFLAKADIHEDDMDEVLDWARFKGVSVSEAHKQLKPSLDIKTEERNSALATETGKGARGGSKVDGASLLEKAESTGEVPDDDAGMTKLAEARMARLKAEANK